MVKSKLDAKSTKFIRRNTRAQAERQSMIKIPTLPNEIVDSILTVLQVDGDFSTLCSIAQASRNMYNLAIPKIYETVVFNKNNQGKIRYGHGKLSKSFSMDGVPIRPSRKDLAVSCTHKLVFNDVPESSISKYYRLVKEVDIGPACLSAARHIHLSSSGNRGLRVDMLISDLKKCLNVVTSPSSLVDSIHISLHRDRSCSYDYHDVGTILAFSETAVPCTYEFFGFRFWSNPKQLHMAYALQGVVHYSFDCPPDSSIPQDGIALWLASHLNGCFEDEDINSPAGQIFLCDTIIPFTLSTLEELHSTETLEDTALIKIRKFITVWPDLSGSQYKSKLEFLKSRVKLVKSGFRPSLADLFPTPQAGLTHILLEEDDLLAPVQRRDEDDGSGSSDEYSGIETSDSGSDFDDESEDEDD